MSEVSFAYSAASSIKAARAKSRKINLFIGDEPLVAAFNYYAHPPATLYVYTEDGRTETVEVLTDMLSVEEGSDSARVQLKFKADVVEGTKEVIVFIADHPSVYEAREKDPIVFSVKTTANPNMPVQGASSPTMAQRALAKLAPGSPQKMVTGEGDGDEQAATTPLMGSALVDDGRGRHPIQRFEVEEPRSAEFDLEIASGVVMLTSRQNADTVSVEIPSDFRDQLLGSGTAAGSAASALGLSGPWYKKAVFYEKEFKAGPVPIVRCISFLLLVMLMVILCTRIYSGFCFPGQMIITWINYGTCGLYIIYAIWADACSIFPPTWTYAKVHGANPLCCLVFVISNTLLFALQLQVALILFLYIFESNSTIWKYDCVAMFADDET
mmetsp:Transcript_14280/g.24891  ORF Transcript_14280/g.24891 Transcript_14280/m.24891 type:complete len:383 (-) Transcript_14280:122-1270(-)|eukprot:CAMPEP_0205903642 /NCGR_PEP_ID=MMETSP1325-20131115/225_1 /ASSEMBLY_ACC=CAM_ASM_000708 /TAXON_ID=236786 /ORGANISM="Florenciella sp., Strain RCC1007" /LENGTH=382 /DNA_ID=CAMNT_0053269315 /DNA_START=176 /DNA_END=1324 /DNA_ORIENTATION=-